MPRPLIVLLLFATHGLVGCSNEVKTLEQARAKLRTYASLPGLRDATHARLRDELARIEEDGGAPLQLMQEKIPDEDNVAAAFRDMFTERKITNLLKRSADLSPEGEFRFDPIALQRAIVFRRQLSEQQAKSRAGLARSRCNFEIAFDLGFGADDAFVDAMRVCGRLEAIAAAELLDHDRPSDALEPMEYMLRLTRWLGEAKHVRARLEAALARAEAWKVLEAIVTHRLSGERELARAEELVRDQLSSWPEDRAAWVGDRAFDLHAYEMIRDGHVLSVLTPDELRMILDEATPREFAMAIQRRVDQDEMYYLEAMRKIIDSCRLPFYERRPVFAEIRADLDEKRASPEFPVIAGRIFLVDVETGQEIQAQDRARAEAWMLALSLALGHKPPESTVNPLTGVPYQVSVEEYRILVSGIGEAAADDRIIVPRMPTASTSP